MTFLHLQLAIVGFACIAIPIIIHLLMRRRRKPIMWGAMRFLMEAYRKQRRRLCVRQPLDARTCRGASPAPRARTAARGPGLAVDKV